MDLAGKAVLVTGGAGFVGSHVVDRLLAQRARITVLDNLSTGFRQFVPEDRVKFIHGDLLDQAVVDRAVQGQDFVFHFAANADVRNGLQHPRVDVAQNVLATHNLLEAMRAHGVKNIAFSSTGSIYGEPQVFPTPEDCPFPTQTSLYGASKVGAEGLLTAYAFGFGFSVWIFRFVSLLGPRYSHGHVLDFWRSLRRDPTKLRVLGDGTQRKSYLHVLDCVDAMWTAIERSRSPNDIHIYNLGQPDWVDVNQSIRIICAELGVAPALEYAGGPRGWVGDAPRILLDLSRIMALGWKPKTTIAESIAETVRFLDKNAFLSQRA
ncbi:MAG: NAD-dependent epimerase/dehydratase family protein [Polyangiaceae bacterium]|nr:NAD-dependent epimerase/dehydratase family protein [Polyangiaceae bacterium]